MCVSAHKHTQTDVQSHVLILPSSPNIHTYRNHHTLCMCIRIHTTPASTISKHHGQECAHTCTRSPRPSYHRADLSIVRGLSVEVAKRASYTHTHPRGAGRRSTCAHRHTHTERMGGKRRRLCLLPAPLSLQDAKK